MKYDTAQEGDGREIQFRASDGVWIETDGIINEDINWNDQWTFKYYFVAAVGMNMIDLISGEIVFLENKVPDQNTTYLHLNTGYSI